MKQPYLSAEMDIHTFGSCDIIHCSDSAELDNPGVYPGDDDVVVTTADPDATTEEWVPSCNQGKPDYNAWG